jgi:hypothetical protein
MPYIIDRIRRSRDDNIISIVHAFTLHYLVSNN